MPRARSLLAAVMTLTVGAWNVALAEEATVAIAANFAEPMERLQAMFEKESDHELTLVVGSTGKLYAQITNGAPFDVLLAADQERPARLVEEDHAAANSLFTYAVGRLSLWSADPGLIGEGRGEAVLRSGDFDHVAIANPELAPYGKAAQQTLEALGLWDQVSPKIVQGENIGQTFQMVATGNAELGFVALSYVVSERNATAGSAWDVPAELHEPIRQDAVLLSHGADNPAATGFLDFLRSPEAQAVIERFGYAIVTG
jgi:molybdate transport system substrate-binding protein